MPSPDGAVLEAAGLTRRFGPVRALDGVDLVVHRGETLAVVGPNAAGKTTLLRCLAGLMRPTTGTVSVLGRVLARDDPGARRPIGLLSHQPLLYGDLTVRENLRFTARLYALPDPAGAAEAALARAGLADRGDSRPRELSRGLLQRAALARALVHEPGILLLDEPFTGLDAGAAASLRALLAERAPAALATVIVTHQPAEVWALATHVGVLRAGRWAELGPRTGEVGEFLARYQGMVHA